MNFIEIFKYNSLISVPLFAVVALSLIKKTTNFSFDKHTVSKSIFFLKHPAQRIMFRLNFVVKTILDFGFILFLINYFKISLKSPLGLFLILSVSLFGSLTYFIEGKYATLHKIIAYSVGIFWALSQIYLARLTKDIFFIKFTDVITITVAVLAFGFMFAKKTNAFVQLICVSILYLWLMIFVFRYL